MTRLSLSDRASYEWPPPRTENGTRLERAQPMIGLTPACVLGSTMA